MSHAKAMDRDNARDLIVAAFRTRMRTTPFAKLRVSDLIKELGLNRNTFYYHFSGKGDLALFAFREDLDRRLRTIAPERELLTQGPGDDPFAGLAFYASVETGGSHLGAWGIRTMPPGLHSRRHAALPQPSYRSWPRARLLPESAMELRVAARHRFHSGRTLYGRSGENAACPPRSHWPYRACALCH